MDREKEHLREKLRTEFEQTVSFEKEKMQLRMEEEKLLLEKELGRREKELEN